MSDDPIHIWWDWSCWLFGFRVSRSEIGLCFGPLSISIMPGRFGEGR